MYTLDRINGIMSRVNDINVDKKIDEKVCRVCNKPVAFAEARLAELPPVRQEGDTEEDFMWCRSYAAIGLMYTHYDRSVCDFPLYELIKI